MNKIAQILIIFLLLHCVTLPPEEIIESNEPQEIIKQPVPEPKISKELEEFKYNEWKKENLTSQRKNSQNFLTKNKLKFDKTPSFYGEKIYFGMTQIEVLEILNYSYEEIIKLSNNDQIETKSKNEKFRSNFLTCEKFAEYKFHFTDNTLYGASVFLNTSIQDTFDALTYKYGKSKIDSKIQSRIAEGVSYKKISFKVDEHYWTKNNIEIIGFICYPEDPDQYRKYLKEAIYCYDDSAFADLDIFYSDKRIAALIKKENAEREKNYIKEKAKKL